MEEISICMIIKNEEKYLENCLNSIKDLADEIIIIDTGSTDKSKEIAKKFTNNIFDFKWENNFSKARNFSLSKATKNWILVLDADEIISEIDRKKIKNLINLNKADAYLFNWRDYTNNIHAKGWTSSENDKYPESKISSGFYTSKALRFFKNKKEYFFEGKIHETINSSIEKNNGKIFTTDIIMHHFGNLDKEKFLNKKKKYSQLLKERLEKKDFSEKTEDYICYELAKELTNLKKNKEAIIYLRKSIEINETPEYLLALGSLHLFEKNLEQAEKILKRVIILKPNEFNAHSNLGIIYAKKKNYNKAIRKFKKAIELNPNFSSAYFNLGILYKNKGKNIRANEFFRKAINLSPEYEKKIPKN